MNGGNRGRTVGRVAVVSGARELCRLIVGLIQSAGGKPRIRAYGDLGEALGRLPASRPDVIFVDARVNHGIGWACVGSLQHVLPRCRIVVITDADGAAVARRALRLGAACLIVEPVTPADIARCLCLPIRTGSDSHCGLFEPPAERRGARRPREAASAPAVPTLREWQVVDELRRGAAYKEIASSLGVSVRTVANHLAHIRDKFQVHSIAQLLAAVAESLRGGALPLPSPVPRHPSPRPRP